MVNEEKVSSGSQAVPGKVKPIKVCYIIGPIRSKWGLIGRLINVWRGRCAAVKLWKAGFAVICPHLNSLGIAMSGVDEDEIVKLDCEIVSRCDFVVLLKGWSDSEGSREEMGVIWNYNTMCNHNMHLTKHYYTTIEGAIRFEEG